MRLKVFIFLLLSTILVSGCGGNYEEDLKQAEEAYQAGDKESAKALYSKAADKGSPEAHFSLAYKYRVTSEESIYHYSEAAKKGHGKALGYALEKLLFRANSLKIADPQGALSLYYKAKKANPDLDLYDEENKLKTMKKCAEIKGFDVDTFMKKYGVNDEDDEFPFYDVWELAEEASRDGRFGEPDPELVFNLVIRGSWVPAELEYAVEETYKNWKNGEVKEFNICDYVTSGAGMGYCMSRADSEDKKDREAQLVDLEEKLNKNASPLLREAYASAVKFIEKKAVCEEGHDGTGRAAWMISSEMKQKNAYLKLIADVQGGFKPTPANSFDKADELLNKTYKETIKGLEAKKDDTLFPLPSVDELREIQRLWIPYRDASVKLFAILNPSVDEAMWKSWLTEIREKQLKDILSL